MPYLHDATQEVARAYDAKTTPDVFVLDPERRLRYRGAPDSDYGDPTPERGLAPRCPRRGPVGIHARPGRDQAGRLLDQVEAVAARRRRP